MMYRCFKTELRIQGGKITDNNISTRQVYNKLNTKHLVSFDEFKNYITNENSIIKKYLSKRKLIEINNAVYLMKKRFTKYVNHESNNQIQALYNSDTLNKNRLIEMLSYFVGPMLAQMICVMIRHRKSDQDIFNFIKSNLHYSDSLQSKLFRMAKICDAIYQNVSNKSSINLLDVGLGNGNKTLQMREMLGCNISGADLEEWGPYKNKSFKFPYKQIQLSPYRIPYNDNIFDCITLILVLHHAEDIISVINECKRMLKPNGIIALVEHDVWSDETNMLIDVQHLIYKKVYNEQTSYFGRYYNFYEWDIIFSKCGMSPVLMNYLTDDSSNYQRYDMQYIAIYKNN